MKASQEPKILGEVSDQKGIAFFANQMRPIFKNINIVLSKFELYYLSLMSYQLITFPFFVKKTPKTYVIESQERKSMK